jgi:hypothetical protein
VRVEQPRGQGTKSKEMNTFNGLKIFYKLVKILLRLKGRVPMTIQCYIGVTASDVQYYILYNILL